MYDSHYRVKRSRALVHAELDTTYRCFMTKSDRNSTNSAFIWHKRLEKTWYKRQEKSEYFTILFTLSQSYRYKWLPETISHGNSRKTNFQVQWNCANTGKTLSSVSFYRYFQVFLMKSKICFRHLVLLERIFCEKIFKTVARNGAKRCSKVTQFCPLLTRTCHGFLLTTPLL